MPLGFPMQQMRPATPEEIELYERYQAAVASHNLRQRQLTLQWAMVFCNCRKPCGCGKPHPEPPQIGCVVHQGFMITEDGKIL